MKTFSRLAFALVCVGALALSPAQSADDKSDLLTPAERAWLAAHPRIVLGAGEDWAPYVIADSRGRLSGFAVDHLTLLNRKLGADIRLEAGPWHEMVAKAEARAIDGLTLTAPVAERAERFAFSDAFTSAYDFIYLRTGDLLKRDAPRGLDGLRGQRVGYLRGTVRISRELEQFKSITAVPAASYAELAQMLLSGDVDAAISAYTLEYWRTSNGVAGITPARVIQDTEARLVVSVRKDWPELIPILNKGLAAIDKSEMDSIYQRWFGADYLVRTATFGATFSAEERAWLAAHPVVRVAVDPEWAPVEFVDGAGVARGMSVAYLDRLSKMLGVRFEVVTGLAWAEAVQRLSEQQLDLLPAIAETPERRERVRFTEPYLAFPAAIFSAADVAYLGGPESLQGKAVAVVKDEAVEAWLRREWPDLRLVPFRDTREALRAVARGDAFAFVGNLVTTSYHIGQSALTQVKVAGETPFVYRLGMGVRSDWPIFAGILQKGIDAIPARERDAIYRDWIAIRYQHSVDYSRLWWLAGAAGLIILAVFAERTRALRRANARLQRLAKENALVEERERQRLATELHDSPMQKLALAQIQFGSARREAGAGAAGPMATGLDLMREAIDELRSLQFELSPPMLHREGLAPALRWLASHASERAAVAFSFRDRAPGRQLAQERAIVLFQCARELVYNVAKHASARTASIELDVGDSEAILTVADNGKGVLGGHASREQRPGGGFGLFSIRERLALFGGSLAVASDAAGTRAVVRMPIGLADRPPAPDDVPLADERSRPDAAAS
jgi:ABC-type amino acid transport substrate-binding protein/two-component sensor histidine kinase